MYDPALLVEGTVALYAVPYSHYEFCIWYELLDFNSYWREYSSAMYSVGGCTYVHRSLQSCIPRLDNAGCRHHAEDSPSHHTIHNEEPQKVGFGRLQSNSLRDTVLGMLDEFYQIWNINQGPWGHRGSWARGVSWPDPWFLSSRCILSRSEKRLHPLQLVILPRGPTK